MTKITLRRLDRVASKIRPGRIGTVKSSPFADSRNILVDWDNAPVQLVDVKEIRRIRSKN